MLSILHTQAWQSHIILPSHSPNQFSNNSQVHHWDLEKGPFHRCSLCRQMLHVVVNEQSSAYIRRRARVFEKERPKWRKDINEAG
jgi:hypothetical protein